MPTTKNHIDHLFRLLDTRVRWKNLASYLEYIEIKKALKLDTRLNELFLKTNPPIGDNPFYEGNSPLEKEF